MLLHPHRGCSFGGLQCQASVQEPSAIADRVLTFSPCRRASSLEAFNALESLSSNQSEQCALACEEDSALPPPSPEAPANAPWQVPPFSSSSVGSAHTFIAQETADAIRNELCKQNGIIVVPQRSDALRFTAVDRPRVVSWLVEVVTALGLSREALFAAVSLLDRFVASTETLPPENVLQLLALACISLAAKHEEVAQYRADDWIGLAVDAVSGQPLYQRADLQRMEYLLLETVEWRIRVPSAFTFLQHFLHCVAHAPTAGVLPRDTAAAREFRRQASFLAELSLLYDCFLSYGYSTVAVACLVLSEWTTKGGAPGGSASGAQPAISAIAALTSVVGVDVTDLAPNLAPCVEALHQLFAQASTAGLHHTDELGSQLGCLAPVVLRHMQHDGFP